MRIVLCLAAITFPGIFSTSIDSHPLSDEFINHINSQQTTWKAGRNFDEDTSMYDIRSLLGAFITPGTRQKHVRIHEFTKDADIPVSFDAREHWPECESIKVIKDQSSCGSSWAVAAASAISDRICIHSEAEKKIYVSDEDLLSCCAVCGNGCDGGDTFFAWLYWLDSGIVSGGPYNSNTGCKAYSLQPCQHYSSGDRPQCSSFNSTTPSCNETCDDQSHLIYATDKSYGLIVYPVTSDEEIEMEIQIEILEHGPVGATFDVYSDFLSYKSGIYQHVAGNKEGEHAVKVIGWGVENGVNYWLVANSWNEDWGDEGLFKIIRGSNECEFENDIVAGLPRF
ncbi:hypothetical protein JTB14_037353 [Gonioctena quinquepunctata]|nr:hypothetical protein JTB14_037353 [Gonioctena quinquepunctata]